MLMPQRAEPVMRGGAGRALSSDACLMLTDPLSEEGPPSRLESQTLLEERPNAHRCRASTSASLGSRLSLGSREGLSIVRHTRARTDPGEERPLAGVDDASVYDTSSPVEEPTKAIHCDDANDTEALGQDTDHRSRLELAADFLLDELDEGQAGASRMLSGRSCRPLDRLVQPTDVISPSRDMLISALGDLMAEHHARRTVRHHVSTSSTLVHSLVQARAWPSPARPVHASMSHHQDSLSMTDAKGLHIVKTTYEGRTLPVGRSSPS